MLNVLRDLEQAALDVQTSTERRDQLIVEARTQGVSWERISDAAHLSRSGVTKIWKKEGRANGESES